ncbi:ribosome biogenesis/translation initiation ATPase RLI [Candidatus Woesearchaeota archaeon]|nr:ribosome biogenesis/translation initiation ATPase RLI [Candidatus Woesearchaeota archaeon]
MSKRIAVIDREKIEDKDEWFRLVSKACPINRTGEDCVYMDNGNIGIDESLCIGCGICVKKDPFEATSIVNLPEALNKEPIHRYGQNGFSLYNLPVPIFGRVVGIIGRNGIGKTTALKILAGLLNPNLGKVEEKDFRASQKDIIEYFKGTEAQAYFQKLFDKKIRVSYKPQQVDLIPKNYEGKVEDLLKKVNEKSEKEFNDIVKLLDLSFIMDHDVKDVSGGELQRIAIAAAVLKKANVYFFDEPTSYLDIKQRLKVSRFIRNLADENTAVMIIEHDLIILDYLTDLIHLMYGKESVYGVASGVKSTKEGINTYLEGYLKEENIRFRDSKIEFFARAPEEKQKSSFLTQWKKFTKKFGKDKFELNAEDGEICRNEIIGILGENAIGKTTFVKVLAGEMKADDRQEELKGIKVAYKPQYISLSSEKFVAEVLKKALADYKAQLIRPLNLDILMKKRLDELSGGELQRVAIAYCLSQNVDMFLIDEPSAYLDVEQRLAVSKVIRNLIEEKGKSALVVDHDLLFIDYLSHRLMIFEGEPAKKGSANKPMAMEEGMNNFLKDLGITFRRDEHTHRPRANKENSVKDREQKKTGNLYYTQ